MSLEEGIMDHNDRISLRYHCKVSGDCGGGYSPPRRQVKPSTDPKYNRETFMRCPVLGEDEIFLIKENTYEKEEWRYHGHVYTIRWTMDNNIPAIPVFARSNCTISERLLVPFELEGDR